MHMCRFADFHPLVHFMRDGGTLCVTTRNPLVDKRLVLKDSGIHLILEGDDDYGGDESSVEPSLKSVSEKMAEFFNSVEDAYDPEAGLVTYMTMESRSRLRLTIHPISRKAVGDFRRAVVGGSCAVEEQRRSSPALKGCVPKRSRGGIRRRRRRANRRGLGTEFLVYLVSAEYVSSNSDYGKGCSYHEISILGVSLAYSVISMFLSRWEGGCYLVYNFFRFAVSSTQGSSHKFVDKPFPIMQMVFSLYVGHNLTNSFQRGESELLATGWAV
ncbi:hypothetical protein Ahy_B05g078025 [Arachis hypogaea]|uniref:Uncharacterized protein n=1 Tax=Arachis hypogaea TaxID=3818 RepID=A0A444Z645_ARAHY|nr:hypothetical protein Ahy_B05g078025 [Arachis hypogaea]